MGKNLEKTPEDTDTFRIGIAGSYTVEPIVPYLKACLQGEFGQSSVQVAPYNQIYQTCISPMDIFGGAQLSAIILLWRLEDLFPDALIEASHPAQQYEKLIYSELDKLISALLTLRNSFPGIIVVSSPPYPDIPAFDLLDIHQYQSGGALYKRIVNYWESKLDTLGSIAIIDQNSLLLHSGFTVSHDSRKWYLYKQPYTERHCEVIGKQLGRILKSQIVEAKKCIVLDCDNTLWGGIIGEDGLAGIDIGQDFPGSAFLDFQKYLINLKGNGVLLCIASKNNEQDVYEVFDCHDAMALTRADISVFEVHWKSKVESLSNIGRSLNIDLDSMVFIDDNPREIAEVSALLPQVTCLLLPEEVSEIPGFLQGSGLFDKAAITVEDRNRSQMIAAERQRESISESLGQEEFLRTLKLEVEVFPVREAHIGRVSQLINKTNQFNLTTIRRSQAQVEAISRKDDAAILAMKVTDHFGDYGLAGVAILEHSASGRSHIETLLISCRVLGRNVETAFLSCIAQFASAQGSELLTGKYVPSKKNQLVEGFFKAHGFRPDDHELIWEIMIDDLVQTPDHISAILTGID